MQVIENMIKALQRLAVVLAALAAIIIFGGLPVAAYDGPYLTGCGWLNDREVIFLVDNDVKYPPDFSDSGVAWAIDRATGEIVRELFSARIAAKLLPEYEKWDILGIDAHCRVYVACGWNKLAIVDDETVQFTSAIPGPVRQTGDDFIMGASRFWEPKVGPIVSLVRVTPAATPDEEPKRETWEILSYSFIDIPACDLAVSPDGEFMYVQDYDGAAWIWDRQRNLRGVIGFCYSRWLLADRGIDPECFKRLDRVFVESIWGNVFDRQNRLIIHQDGKMWGYNVDGRRITALMGFELRGPDDKVVTPHGRYVFAPWDNHLFVLSKEDRLIYEFDISPVFEKELDELHGLWFPGKKPPIFVRSIEPEGLPSL